MTLKNMMILKNCLTSGSDDAKAVLDYLERGEDPPRALVDTMVLNLEIAIKKINEAGWKLRVDKP